MNTSIIILTYNNLEYTKKCLESIRKYTKSGTYEIIIVDNNSKDGTKEYLKTLSDVKIIYNKKNLGFPKGCNQGIKKALKNNDILLLNNDTLVTANWLDNLRKCLNSDKLIGAVGAVCNNNENRQGLLLKYQNMEEMQKKALENNVSNEKRWEEKVFLIGFCILIKREVIDKLNGLDENYTPGYIEDNDLSLRIINLGYKLMLCHDAFIYHYLGTSFRKDLSKFYPILNKNRAYFLKKWHFDTFTFDDIKSSLFPLVEKTNKILDINCGIGVTALALKYKFPNTQITGLELDENKRKIASKFINVYSKLEDINEKFDYILIGDLLEKIDNPKLFITKIGNYLNAEGNLILNIHNPVNIKNINKMLKGEFINNQTNFFTLNDINNLLKENNFINPTIFSWYENLNEEEKTLLNKLKEYKNNIYYTCYTIKAKIK